MEKNAALVLLNNSLGEIHFILPYLKRLRSASGTDVYVYFINAKIYNKAVDDPFYYDQIVEHASILKPNDLLSFLLRHRKRVSLILKDTTPLTENNIVIKIKQLCPRAVLALFPHAYALLGYQQGVVQQGKTVAAEDRYVDHVLYVHPYDAPVLAQRYAPDKLLFAGALGYSPWWSTEVGRYVDAHRSKLEVTVPANQLVVLFTLRDAHRLYLSEENLEYLLTSSLEILFTTTKYFVIIKPHPRQRIETLTTFLAKFDPSRYAISYYNTFVLSKFSDLNLSFWSSAVTDCLAMGIPAIEFHRFHVGFGQTTEDKGSRESFYSYLGLTTAVNSKEALQNVLPRDKQGIDALFAAQRPVLEEVFSNAEQGVKNVMALSHGQRETKPAVSGLGKARIFSYFFLKFIFRKIKPV